MNLTDMPPLYVKFLANYIQGRRAYTVYNQTKSKQRSFHAGVPQGGVLSPALFNLFMSDIPKPDNEKGQDLATYADDVTLLASHEKIRVAEVYAQEYLDKIIQWMSDNNLILADKTQATLCTPDSAEYNHQLNLNINGVQLETVKHPKILGLYFDPKLTFNEHTKKTEAKAKGTLKLIKALSGTDWGQQQETLVTTYKQFTRPILEYACPAWAPTTSATNVERLQRVQNAALRTATGHTQDTNIVHLHRETKVLPLNKHMRLITSQYRESCMDNDHPQHAAAVAPDPDRQMKMTAFNTSYITVVHSCTNEGEEKKERIRNKKRLHTAAVSQHLEEQPIHPLLGAQPPDVHKEEQSLSRNIRRNLAQLRAQKSPVLKEYLHNIGVEDSPLCPLCGQSAHNTIHLFRCTAVQTELTPIDLWRRPARAADLLQRWRADIEAAEMEA